MKSLCQNSEDRCLVLQASTMFATATTALSIIFIMPMVIAAPVGMICGRTFWSGDLLAVEAWIQSALLCAISAAAVLVAAASFVRIYMRSQFGAPTFYGELQVDLSHEETRKMCRAYLRAEALDETFVVDRSERRQIALVQESKFSTTFLEVSTTALDDDRTWIVFRGASKLSGAAVLMSAFFNDFGSSRDSAQKMMKIFSPYASTKKRRSAAYRPSKQAVPRVRLVDLTPPPAMRKGQRYQHECTESDMRHLKACS
jgi:hypothetical protein